MAFTPITTTGIKPYTAALASSVTTQLDALATAVNSAAGTTITNSTILDRFMDLELVLPIQAAARSAGATFQVYMVVALDNSNFSDVSELSAELVATFGLTAATAAQRVFYRKIELPPQDFKLFGRNLSGQPLAATLNLLRHRTYSGGI